MTVTILNSSGAPREGSRRSPNLFMYVVQYKGMKRFRVGELHENGEGTGKYHMISSDSRGTRPIGYCRGRPVTTKEGYEEKYTDYPKDWDDEDDPRVRNAEQRLRINRWKLDLFGHKYHEEPHDSKEEARQCYAEYCFDLKFATYDEDDTELKRYHGAQPSMLSEPIEDEEVPADVEGRECDEPECDTIVAHPTAEVKVFGAKTRFYLCSDHCSREVVEEFWECPTSGFSS